MRLGGTIFGSVLRPQAAQPSVAEALPAGPSQPGFGAYLERALGQVDQMQQSADAQAQAIATGHGDIDRAVVAVQQAELAVQLTVQVTQRAIQAYQEVTRMQL